MKQNYKQPSITFCMLTQVDVICTSQEQVMVVDGVDHLYSWSAEW